MSHRDNPMVTMVMDLQHDKHRLQEQCKELRAQAGKLRGELKDADEYTDRLEEEIADLRCSYKEALHQLSKLRRAAA